MPAGFLKGVFFWRALMPENTSRNHSPGAPRKGPQRHPQEATQKSPQIVSSVGHPLSISSLVRQLGLSHIRSTHLSSWTVSEHCCHVRFTIQAGILVCYICKLTNAQRMVTISELDSFVKASFTSSLIQSMRSLDFFAWPRYQCAYYIWSEAREDRLQKKKMHKKTIASASDNRDLATPMRGSATGQAWNCYRASDP